MIASFEVGAVFIVEDQSSRGLASIGRAFEKLDEMVLATQDRLKTVGEGAFSGLKVSVDMAITETARLITQANEVALAWERAGRAMAGAGGIGSGEAAAAGAGPRSGGGGGSRRGGGGGGRGEEWTAEDQAALALKQQIAEARLNATADNRNADQIYSRQEAAAKRENIERDLLAKRDDGITIPSPPRTGVTEFHYGQSTPGPRNDVMGLPDVVAREKELAKAEADAAKRKAAVAGGSNDIIQTILDYELLHMGFKAATAQQESLFRGAKAFGIDPTSEEGRKSMVLLDMASRDAAANTSYKRTQTAEGISLLAGPFGLTGPEGVKTFAGIYPGAARAAEGLELIDPANHFKETLPAMMGYMHASRQYEADKLPHTYDLLGIITGLIPHTTFAAEAKAMAYVAPLARAAGIPADEVAMDVGILQQAGLGGTIGATTLRQELVGLTRGGEQMPKTRHSHMLAHETKEFENALKMQGDEGRAINEATKGNAHMRAMTEIGLFDAQGHRTFLYKPGNIEGGDVGGVDLNEANRIFARWANRPTTRPADVLQAGNDLFGIRGELAPEILANIIRSGDPNSKDYGGIFRNTVNDRLKSGTGHYLEDARNQMSQAAGQQEGQVAARFNDILNSLATITLPAFQTVLKDGLIPLLNKIATLLAPDEKGGYTLGQKAATYSAVGAAVGGSLGGVTGLLFGGGVGFLPGAAFGSLIGGGIGGLGAVTEAAYNRDTFKTNNPLAGRIGPTPYALALITAPSGPGGITPQFAQSSQPFTSVTIHNTMNGVADEKTFQSMLDRLKDMIKSAISHATEQPHGTDMSPYAGVSGGL